MTGRKRRTAILVRVIEQEKRKLERQARRAACPCPGISGGWALANLRQRSPASGSIPSISK